MNPKKTKEIVQIDVEEPQEKELFKELAGMTLGSHTGMQVGKTASSFIERRSCRLDKKNKGWDIPTAKRA